jgi:hypothetical protein
MNNSVDHDFRHTSDFHTAENDSKSDNGHFPAKIAPLDALPQSLETSLSNDDKALHETSSLKESLVLKIGSTICAKHFTYESLKERDNFFCIILIKMHYIN